MEKPGILEGSRPPVAQGEQGGTGRDKNAEAGDRRDPRAASLIRASWQSSHSLLQEDRLLPLVMSADTTSGQLAWQGTYLVNPWRDGRLVDLADYPKLASYFNTHADLLRARHIAKKRPTTWYRTIDRVAALRKR